jgi:hypothetical protein
VSDTPSRYGLIVVCLGIGAVIFVAVFAMSRWASAADVATVISPVSGLISTVVAAYFGFQVGASGKDKSEKQRDRAVAQVRELAGSLAPNEYEKIRQANPDLFGPA